MAKRTKAAAIIAPRIRARLQAIVDKPIHLLPNSEHGKRAAAAIAALDRGDVDAAMNLVWFLGNEAGALIPLSIFGRQFRSGIKSYAGAEKSKAKRRERDNLKLQNAIEDLVRLRNDRAHSKGRVPSDFALRKKAAKNAGITERFLRDHLPPYLEN